MTGNSSSRTQRRRLRGAQNPFWWQWVCCGSGGQTSQAWLDGFCVPRMPDLPLGRKGKEKRFSIHREMQALWREVDNSWDSTTKRVDSLLTTDFSPMSSQPQERTKTMPSPNTWKFTTLHHLPLSECTIINYKDVDFRLNSKAEFHQPAIPRVLIT